jgi:hypothetical protein
MVAPVARPTEAPSPEEIFPKTGYRLPQYTQIPDLLLDYQMAHLTGAELKVVLYICRRTFGFKKDTDAISFNQMLEGIVTQDGRRLDYGTGLSRDSLNKAIKSLEAKGIILVIRSADAKGSKQTNLYALNVGQTPDAPMMALPEPRLSAPKLTAPKSAAPQPATPQPTAPKPIAPKPANSRADTPVNRAGEGSPKIVLGGSTENGLGGSPKIVLGGSPENRLGGSPKNGLTINSSNNKQLINKQNNNNTAPTAAPVAELTDGPRKAVVVALQAVGISMQVAQQLAGEFSPECIQEKLAYLAFLQAKDVVHRPAGWLRRAIVEDYGRPDGFETADERETRRQAEQAEQSTRLAEQAAAQRAVEQQHTQRRTQREQQLQRLRAQQGAQPHDRLLGDELVDLLRTSCSKDSLLYAILPVLALIKYADRQALFAVGTQTALQQVQHPGTQAAIRRALCFLHREVEPHLKQHDIGLEFLLLEEEEPPARPAALPSASDWVAPRLPLEDEEDDAPHRPGG